jgi:protein phosphatase-4 regulatory subunit 3
LLRVAWFTLYQQNYIRKLVELFRTCEDLENDEGLQLMFKIVKGISKLKPSLCSSICTLIP